MISVAQFRSDFPEFADVAKFPNATVTFWLNIASLMLSQDRFGPSAIEVWPVSAPFPTLTIFDYAVELFVAHNLSLGVPTAAQAAAGLGPGMVGGLATSKSVDKVSVSYDVNVGIVQGAGHWNLTIYGLRLYQLLLMFGAGPIQVGPGLPALSGSALAYAGPIMWPPG